MILTIFVYTALFAFIFLSLAKAWSFAKMPMHSRWELYPVPKEKGRGEYGGSYYEEEKWFEKPREVSFAGELKDMLKEMLFIKNLFVHQRPMWWVSYALHLGIYTLFLWTAMLFVGAITELSGSVVAAETGGWATLVYYVTYVTGIIGAILVAFGTIGLLFRRLTVETLKIYSTPQDYFNLLFIFAVTATGLMAWAADPAFNYGRDIFKSLLTFSPIQAEGALALHIVLLGLLLLYIPQTKMSHYVGKYFSFHTVLWENDPNLPGSEVERKVREGSKFKPSQTWSAPHWQPGKPKDQ
ncbi:nitrate reductase gamma subunit [Desulfitispora alkaliphila]|uniref:respiratory nitrate reductase subunit gamma n=1 Tax=Desulfitispora alkaliphila TaxID=622674 RepID=UPI003D21C803